MPPDTVIACTCSRAFACQPQCTENLLRITGFSYAPNFAQFVPVNCSLNWNMQQTVCYHTGYGSPGARELSSALLKCYGVFGLGFLAQDPHMIGSHSATYRTFMKWNPKRRGVTAQCPKIQKSKVPGNNNKRGEQQRPQHKISNLS